MTTTAVPTTPAEFEEYLKGDTLAADLAAGAPFSEKLNGYITAMVAEKNKAGQELSEQVKVQVQMQLAEMLEDEAKAKRLNLNPAATRSGPGSPVPSDRRAPAAGLDGVFLDAADFLQSTWHRARPTAEQQERLEKLLAYSENVPAEGGFLVPEEFRREILELSLESAIVRPRATVIPMGTKTLELPAIDDTSHASTVFGGVAVYRTEEQAELTESAATFRRVKLDLTTQTALAHVPNDLIEDTQGAITAWITSRMGPAVGWFEDQDYQLGTGAGEPLGALRTTNPATVSVAKQTGQEAGSFVFENAVDMFARLLPTSMDRAVWVISPDVFPELATMGLVVGTGGGPIWLPDATGTPRMTLLGRPILVTEKTPAALGTRGDITLIDYSYYLIGDGRSMRIDSSPHVKFTSNQTSFRMTQRNDGRPAIVSPLTPANGSATLTSTVQVDTRA